MIYPLLSARVWLGAAAAVLVIWLAAVVLFGVAGLGAQPERELVAGASTQSLLAR